MKNLLRNPIYTIKSVTVMPTPKNCPYLNEYISITYNDNSVQNLTHKNDNPNDLSYDFDSHEEMINYYNKLMSHSALKNENTN